MNYYNDNDPKACAWLRELIAAGELPEGDVDCRSITEIKADDLAGYDQCHFFAGIGGWALALRWAGLEGVSGIWTGSCPCQPLSCAGKRQGHTDERHLWPAFHGLIAECRPATVFGEQVASKDGREWFAGVRLDLEGLGYACGGADLCAAGVGAPHRRQRLYWVADATGQQNTKNSKDPQRMKENGAQTCLADAAHLAGWNTPRATDGSNGGPNQAGGALPADASLAGWSTPDTVPDAPCMGSNATKTTQGLGNQARGVLATSSPAATASSAAFRLNPRFSLWLMGYPDAWASCGERVMQLFQKSRRRL